MSLYILFREFRFQMKKFTEKGLFAALFFLCTSAPTYATEAIAIWTEKVDDSYHVFIGELIEDEWQKKPRSIYNSENQLTTATIGSDSKGNWLAIWSMTLNDRMILMESSFNGDEWSSPSPLGDLKNQNISATITYDLADTPWVFWVSDSDGLSDIYMTNRVVHGWNSAAKVNDYNEVPDVFPLAGLDKKGDIVVTWQAFSFESNSYQSKSRTFSSSVIPSNGMNPEGSGRVASCSDKDKACEELSLANVPYVTGVTRINIHYPKNMQLQSEFLGFR